MITNDYMLDELMRIFPYVDSSVPRALDKLATALQQKCYECGKLLSEDDYKTGKCGNCGTPIKKSGDDGAVEDAETGAEAAENEALNKDDSEAGEGKEKSSARKPPPGILNSRGGVAVQGIGSLALGYFGGKKLLSKAKIPQGQYQQLQQMPKTGAARMGNPVFRFSSKRLKFQRPARFVRQQRTAGKLPSTTTQFLRKTR